MTTRRWDELDVGREAMKVRSLDMLCLGSHELWRR